MKFEQDEVRLLGGVRHGRTQGGPIAIEIGNTEWPKWVDVMSSDPVEDPDVLLRARNAPLTRPRPGHADLVGMRKYGFDDARPVLERASARETATRVALGTVAARFLEQAAGVRLVSHVVEHRARRRARGRRRCRRPTTPPPSTPTRCAASTPRRPRRWSPRSTSATRTATRSAASSRCSPTACRPGSGSYVHSDRRLDGRLAAALMGIQAIKGVEVGDGFRTAARRGSQAHDEIERDASGRIVRRTNRAGGLEGGMTNGEILRVRAAMKPISTVPRALDTVDTATGEAAKAQHQRSDVCAVPPAAVVAEAMVALVLADALLAKTGGDSVAEVRRNLEAYVASIPDLLA